MGQQLASDEITFATHHDDDSFYATVKRVTIILSIVTVVEVLLGLVIYWMGDGSPLAILLIKGMITILSLAKAFYITAYFMHLGDEIRNLIMTIVVPLALFIWFIAAFLLDGASWRNLKNTQAGSKPAVTEQVAPVPPAAVPEGAEK